MKVIKAYCLAIAVMIGLTAYSQTVIQGGYVSGTWEASGSPYMINDTIIVHPDSSLSILAGVDVFFEDSSAFFIYGQLEAKGTTLDSIRFMAVSAHFSGILVNTADTMPGDSIRFSYCVFKGRQRSTGDVAGMINIRNSHRLSIVNSTFKNNETNGFGGAIKFENADILCRNSVFTQNRASSETGNGMGGAIYASGSSPHFINCLFTLNEAEQGGGAYMGNSGSLFDKCTFWGNISAKSGGALGAEASDEMIVRRSRFVNNYAEEHGGAIYFGNMSARIEDTDFEQNLTSVENVASRGGALYLMNGDYYLIGLEFTDNQALVGGALYAHNSNLTIHKCNFIHNVSLAGGGAMVNHKSGLVTVDDCLFENNVAGGSGGAVAILEGMWIRFMNCSFINNSSHSELYLSDGGGVFITPYDNLAFFINCSFSHNSAKDYGGGVYATSITQLVGCLFNANVADTDSTGEVGGGAIALSLASFPIMNCTFSGNAGGPGTTIYCEDAEFTMINSILWDDNPDSNPKIFMSTIEDAPKAFIDHCDIEPGNGIIRGTGPYEVVWASGNISVNPEFELPGEDFRLSDISPCIDTARSDTLNVLIPAKDLAGNPRIFRGAIDMGCYENQTPFMIGEDLDSQDILIYPNPAVNNVYISSRLNDNIDAQLKLIDMSGKMLRNEKVHLLRHGRQAFSLKGLAPGFYILHLQAAEKVYSRKLIIE
ncbi:MAG: T9SS type A sorting domain-containing protein [Bacteroidales bacterium]|nr:T9SS type A sorting domain-containing protein [Bacteroidales bacterium]